MSNFPGPGPQQILTVKEVDGSPSVSGVTTVKVSNGTLTDDGSGVVSINTAGTTPASNITIPMLLSSTEVNLNEGTAAKQPLYTCPANRRCVVVNLIFHDLSGAFASPVALHVGWDAGATDVTTQVGSASIDFFNTTWAQGQAFNASVPDLGNGVIGMAWNPQVGTAGQVLGLVVGTPKGSALTGRVDVIGYWTDTSGVPIANVVGTAP